MTITMDGVAYNLGVVFQTMTRSFEFVEGRNGGMSLSGDTILDTIGTKYGYTMNVEPVTGHQSDYDAFYYAISRPERKHQITMPFGQSTISFACYVLGGSDSLQGRHNQDYVWGGLSVQIVPLGPQRR